MGASSGIGRAVGLAASAAGADIALAARQYDQLTEVAREAGPNAIALQCDVRVPIACELAVRAAVQHLHGLDVVVFATGVNHLAMLVDTPLEAWRDVLETNLIGAALTTRAVLPELRTSGGRIAYLSSHSVGRPWPGLGAYAASKAGLDAMINAWRNEEPGVSFTRVIVGPTITGMADDWDPATAAAMFDRWSDEGYMTYEPATAESVADRIVRWAASDPPAHDLHLVDTAAS